MRCTGCILCFVLVVGLSVIGCEEQEAAPDAPAAPAAPAGEPAAPAAPAPTGSDTPAIPTPDHTPATQAVGAAADTAAANTATATAEAQKLLDQAVAYIKDNKLDLAEKAVTQLEGMKASLPEAMQARVADVRKLLDTAKATGAIKAPALPGAPQ